MGRIITQEEAVEVRQKARREGQVIVFTNGCFDILHRGHVQYLESAKKLGALLIVGVNSDSSVRRLKGGKRPVIPLEDRMAVLASLGCVDYVVSFDEDTPAGLIDAIAPDVLVKGGDWKVGDVVGRETVEKGGGRVVIIDFLEGYSTKSIIQRIVSRCGPGAGQESERGA